MPLPRCSLRSHLHSNACVPQTHMKPNEPTALHRPLTRAFAKRHELKVQDFTLDDLDIASGRTRSQRPPRVLSTSAPPRASRSNQVSSPRPHQTHSEGTPDEEVGLRASHVEAGHRQSQPQGGQRFEQTDAHHVLTETNQLPLLIATNSKEGDHFSTVSTWLRDLDPAVLPTSEVTGASEEALQNISTSDIQDMESSSSINTGDSAANDEQTSTKASTAKKLVSFIEHLEFRGINAAASEDRKLQDFNLDTIVQVTPREISFQQFDNLLKTLELRTRSLKRSIQDKPLDNGFPFYDALRNDIMEWRPQPDGFRRFPPITQHYFNWDRRDCINSSEATFHRTIMMSIIDRYDFHNCFTYSCEEQWVISPQFLIPPVRSTSKISQPKPDLAISFHRNALIGSDIPNYPPELGKCLRPSKNGRERWFPFLFMEAKRDDCSLQDAFEKNLHSASQALLNIYHWVRIASDLAEKFFTEVRVFSIDLNNEDMTLRMHRAERDRRDRTDRLRFEYSTVVRIRDYDQFDTCHIIKSVLVDYAQERLLPILKTIFKRVAQSGASNAGRTKRTHDAMQAVPSAVEEPEVPALETASTGLSFGAGSMRLEEPSNVSKRSRPGLGRRKVHNADKAEA